jgi:hypothetical protein
MKRQLKGIGPVSVYRFREMNDDKTWGPWMYRGSSKNRYNLSSGERFTPQTYHHLRFLAKDIVNTHSPEEEIRISDERPYDTRIVVPGINEKELRILEYDRLSSEDITSLISEIESLRNKQVLEDITLTVQN